MIAYLKGTLAVIDPTYAIVECNQVGYLCKISLNTFADIKEAKELKLFTWLQVKEDAHTLFGFSGELEKQTFLELISVSGIGAGTALMMLSSLTPHEVRKAIATEDLRTIQAIKGIGAKTAQRVILELKDKMKKLELSGDFIPGSVASVSNNMKQEALNALVTLGFTKAVAEKNIDAIVKQKGEHLTIEELIKLALRSA